MREWARDFPAWCEANKAPFFTPETSRPMQDWLTAQLLDTPVPGGPRHLPRAARPRPAPGARGGHLVPDAHPAGHAGRLRAPGDQRRACVAAGIPHARLEVYDGAPHGLFITHLERVNADLEALLRA